MTSIPELMQDLVEVETASGGWRSIESAPKDGTRVLCWNREWQDPETGCIYGMSWAANGLAADLGGWKYQPTHWQPLPQPPKETP